MNRHAFIPFPAESTAAGRLCGDARRSLRAGPARAALALAGMFGLTTLSALGAPPASPAFNHVWGGCTLNSTTVNAIRSRVEAGAGIAQGSLDSQISFIVVYGLTNDNDGQPVKIGSTTGVTGPIVCTNNVAGNPDKVTIDTTTETTPIPPLADQAAGVTVDTTSLEETLILQYKRSDKAKREKRICLTVAGNTDCFLIKPDPHPAP